jgi:cell division protein FtsN
MTARDYKRTRPYQPPFSGWTGLALGLGAGLLVGLAVFWIDRRGDETAVDATGAAPPAEPAAQPPPMSARATETAPSPEAAERYDFYDMLPKFEVVVPEREKDVRPGAPSAPLDKPGNYVLQAGSYRDFAEADRIRAQLALQGIDSKVQKVSVDTDTWHRVRIGPISDLKELNRIRERLHEADIDVLLIRVPE